MQAFRYIGLSFIQIIQECEDLAVVEGFQVDPDDREKGVGTKLMEDTCADADKELVTLVLEPCPYGIYDPETEIFHPPSLSYKQLCAFYRKFGFRFRRPPFGDQMIRTPKKEG